jgi:hypothetical protein
MSFLCFMVFLNKRLDGGAVGVVLIQFNKRFRQRHLRSPLEARCLYNKVGFQWGFFVSCGSQKISATKAYTRPPRIYLHLKPQHRSSKNESIQTIIFIQPGLSRHPFSCRITSQFNLNCLLQYWQKWSFFGPCSTKYVYQ